MPHEIMGFLDRVRIAHSKEKAATPVGVKLSELPPVGAEQTQELGDYSTSSIPDDAFSDAFSDSRLVKLIEVWPALSDDVRDAIRALADASASSDFGSAVRSGRAASGDSAG